MGTSGLDDMGSNLRYAKCCKGNDPSPVTVAKHKGS